MGFNVVIFESGCSEGNFLTDTKHSILPDSMISYVFSRSGHTKVNERLMEYLKDPEIIISGTDIQFSNYELSNRYFRTYLYPLCPGLINKLFHYDSLFIFKTGISTPEERSKRKMVQDTLLSYYDSVYTNARNSQDYFRRLNIKAQRVELVLLALKYRKKITSLFGTKELTSNKRDELMRDLLVELAETAFPNEKIIVWAHNAHIWKRGPKNQSKHLNFRMGAELPKRIKDQSYVIGLYMYEGKMGLRSTEMRNVAKPLRHSLESNMYIPDCKASFLDFAGVSQKTAATSWMFNWTKSYSVGGPWVEKIIPKESYDAVVLINSVTPAY